MATCSPCLPRSRALSTSSSRVRAGPGFAIGLTLLAGCGPPHLADTHTTSTPRPQSFDVAALAREPVAVLGVVTPGGLQGFGPVLAHALDASLSKTSPPIRGIAAYETMNVLNDHGLAAQYADLLAGYSRSGILEREKLRRVGRAVGCRYLLLPGLAQLEQLLADRFEAVGLKIVRNRVVTLRLWLQLWDAETGRIVWESSGETTGSSLLVFVMRAVPVDAMAEKLWLTMIRDGLLGERRMLGIQRVDRSPRVLERRREAP
jgi:hypothetical protein